MKQQRIAVLGACASGEQVHGSLYRYQWSTGPKAGLELVDYSAPHQPLHKTAQPLRKAA